MSSRDKEQPAVPVECACWKRVTVLEMQIARLASSTLKTAEDVAALKAQFSAEKSVPTMQASTRWEKSSCKGFCQACRQVRFLDHDHCHLCWKRKRDG